MRSRYTAFHERKPDYILATDRTGSSTPAARADLRSEITRMEWLNLIVFDTKQGGPQDTLGEVTFVAAFRPHMPDLGPAMKLAGMEMPISQIHERSRFEREDGRWVYVSGEHLAPYKSAANAPCWCGQGKKTKHCHG